MVTKLLKSSPLKPITRFQNDLAVMVTGWQSTTTAKLNLICKKHGCQGARLSMAEALPLKYSPLKPLIKIHNNILPIVKG